MNVKSIVKVGVLAAALGTLGACRDSGLEPHAAPDAISAHLLGTSSSGRGDTVVTNFTIDPRSGSRFGVGSSHTLYVPAKSVCDPATSTYGPGTWEQPCVALRDKLVITAKTWTRADGSPAVDFSPSLRFMPASNGDVATLTMKVSGSNTVSNGMHFYYCATPTSSCYDESLTDASLVVYNDVNAGTVSRRIKHFSGYNVSSGFVEESSALSGF